MAPERPVIVQGRAHAPREIPKIHQNLYVLNDSINLQQVESSTWSLPAKVVRQIQKQVAREGRTLQRLEVREASTQQLTIDNLDTLDSERSGSVTPPKYKSEPYDSDNYEDDNMVIDTTATNIEVQMEDNDLTNLTWLQDRNLLRSINLSKGETDEMRPISVQISPQSGMSGASPTSDYLEESYTSEPADSSGSDQIQLSPPHTPFTYSNQSRSSLNFDSPKSNGSPAKLRHPQNVPYNPLVHTENKPPYSFSCLIFMAIENSPAKALPVKEIYQWIMNNFPYFRNAPTGWKNSVRHNLSLNKCFQKVEKSPSLGKGSLWMVDDQHRNNLLQAFSRSPFHPCVPPGPTQSLSSVSSTSSSSSTPTSTSQSRLPGLESNNPKGAPNPQLFPFLSRRLAASSGQQLTDSLNDVLNGHESCDSLDEVVAAAMVLALKHGPGVLPPPLISNCPTQDHTYSAATNNPMGSPEAGYESDEEQRKTAETLLHLAGMPPSPTPQVDYRPRLLRRAPKRSAQMQNYEDDEGNLFGPEVTINNNHAELIDKNNPKIKKARLL